MQEPIITYILAIMNELQQYIKSYFGVSYSDLSKIEERFEETTLQKGDYFLEKDKHCNQLSFIKSGYLRIFVTTEHKEITQWISYKGYFVTELSSLIFNTPSRFNIQALSDCTLYTIQKTDYLSIGKVVTNWDKLEKLFIAKCFITLENRVLNHLSMTAEDRYLELFNENPDLFNQVPLQYLASMLGMTPETLSRIRKKTIS